MTMTENFQTTSSVKEENDKCMTENILPTGSGEEEWLQSVRPKPEIIYETGTLCFMRRNYTMFQNVLLTRILTQMQKIFVYYRKNNAHHEQVQFPTNINMLGKVTISIPMRKLEPHASHFPRIRKNLEEMAQKPIQLPYIADKSKRYFCAQRLFSVQFVKNSYKQPVACLTFSREVMRFMVCMDFGYHTLDVTALKQLRFFSSRRMYHILRCWVVKGNCHYDPRFLVDQLSEKGGVYTNFCNVRDKILDSAQMEMREAYRQGLLNEYFTYSTFPKDTGTKWPERISLMLHMRDDEAPTDANGNTELSAEALQVKLMLTVQWGVKESVALDVVRYMKRWQKPEVENALDTVRRIVKEKAHTAKPVTNVAGYALTAVEKVLKGDID